MLNNRIWDGATLLKSRVQERIAMLNSSLFTTSHAQSSSLNGLIPKQSTDYYTMI